MTSSGRSGAETVEELLHRFAARTNSATTWLWDLMVQLLDPVRRSAGPTAEPIAGFPGVWAGWHFAATAILSSASAGGTPLAEITPEMLNKLAESLKPLDSQPDRRKRVHLARLLDTVAGRLVFDSWTSTTAGKVVRLKKGTWYAVWFPQVSEAEVTSPPDRLAFRDWETARVRCWDGTQTLPKITIDCTVASTPEFVDGALVTLHPWNNAGFGASQEFDDEKHRIGDFQVLWIGVDGKKLTGEIDPQDVHGAGVHVDHDVTGYVNWVIQALRDRYWEISTGKQAAVVVLPEFSGSVDGVEELLAKLERDLDLMPPVLVPGSWYVEKGGTWKNRYEVWFRSKGKIIRKPHDKQVPLDFEASPRPNVPSFTLYQIGHWRVAVVLCRDLLLADVSHQLRRAGVNYVVVPACSTTVEPFLRELNGITGATQARGVVANSPSLHPGWEVPEQMLAAKKTKPVWAVTDLAVFSAPAATDRMLREGPTTLEQAVRFRTPRWVTWCDPLTGEVSSQAYLRTTAAPPPSAAEPPASTDDHPKQIAAALTDGEGVGLGRSVGTLADELVTRAAVVRTELGRAPKAAVIPDTKRNAVRALLKGLSPREVATLAGYVMAYEDLAGAQALVKWAGWKDIGGSDLRATLGSWVNAFGSVGEG